jgi:hypothetical protein
MNYKKMVILLILFILITLNCNSQTAKDIEDIKQILADYVDAFYNADPVKMEGLLHPNLVHRQVVKPDSDKSVLYDSTKDTIVFFVKSGGGKFTPRDSFKVETTILDVQNNIASAVIKTEYVRYLHLAKFNNKWVIINILWDFNRNPK